MAELPPLLELMGSSTMSSLASCPSVSLSALEAHARAPIHTYAAFGGFLRSEIEFPELTSAPEAVSANWTVTVERRDPSLEGFLPVGERRIREEQYRLWRSDSGLRLEYSHAGTFDLLDHGRRIIWYYRADAVPELVRSIVIGPVIALALELGGFLCLHGSAVAIGSRAIAFLGPKHHGKSTLATALTTAGAKLLGDDLLVVSPGPPAVVFPGVASVRLWADMAAALALDSVCNTLIPGVKTTVTGFADAALAEQPAIIDAIYVLSPLSRDADGPAVRRTRLSRAEATVALAHQTKLPDTLVGFRAAGSQLTSAAAVAATVPVWRLHTIRDVARLGTTVRQLIEWTCQQ